MDQISNSYAVIVPNLNVMAQGRIGPKISTAGNS